MGELGVLGVGGVLFCLASRKYGYVVAGMVWGGLLFVQRLVAECCRQALHLPSTRCR